MSKTFWVNWQTTLAGVIVIVGLGVKIIAALKTKDFGTVFADSKELIPDVIALITGLGLIAAKDKAVTGTGDNAVRPPQ